MKSSRLSTHSSRKKTGAVKISIPCPRLETIIFNDFALIDSPPDDEWAGGLAPLVVGQIVDLLVVRKEVGRQITKPILCHCLDMGPGLGNLGDVVPTVDVQ